MHVTDTVTCNCQLWFTHKALAKSSWPDLRKASVLLHGGAELLWGYISFEYYSSTI